MVRNAMSATEFYILQYLWTRETPATFSEIMVHFNEEEKKAWIAKNTDVCLGSDAFFPFGDNIERAHRSGVDYIAQAGGSIRDDNVIETCDKYNIAMAFTGFVGVGSCCGIFFT